MNKNQENLLLYATYNVLYINDEACNLIKELSADIQDADKETKKIYGALHKRAVQYFDLLSLVVGDKMIYFADFCVEMDDICDPLIEDFIDVVEEEYKKLNMGNERFLAKLEAMRTLCAVAVEANYKFTETMIKTIPQANILNMYSISEILKIADNLIKWVYRKVPKDVFVDLNKNERIINAYRKMSSELISVDNFRKSYSKAVEYEYERKNNNGIHIC